MSEGNVPRKLSKGKIALIAAVAAVIVIAVCVYFLTADSRAYSRGVELQKAGAYSEAIAVLETIPDYEDARERINACSYQLALEKEEAGSYAEAQAAFAALGDYLDAAERAEEAGYRQGVALEEGGSAREAADAFAALGSYKDSAARAANLQSALERYDTELARVQGQVEALQAALSAGEVLLAENRTPLDGDTRDALQAAVEAGNAANVELPAEPVTLAEVEEAADALEKIDCSALAARAEEAVEAYSDSAARYALVDGATAEFVVDRLSRVPEIARIVIAGEAEAVAPVEDAAGGAVVETPTEGGAEVEPADDELPAEELADVEPAEDGAGGAVVETPAEDGADAEPSDDELPAEDVADVEPAEDAAGEAVVDEAAEDGADAEPSDDELPAEDVADVEPTEDAAGEAVVETPAEDGADAEPADDELPAVDVADVEPAEDAAGGAVVETPAEDGADAEPSDDELPVEDVADVEPAEDAAGEAVVDEAAEDGADAPAGKVYFASTLVSEACIYLSDADLMASDGGCGGCVELYDTAEAARQRDAALTAQGEAGAHTAAGTLVVRLSDALSAQERQALMTEVLDALTTSQPGEAVEREAQTQSLGELLTVKETGFAVADGKLYYALVLANDMADTTVEFPRVRVSFYDEAGNVVATDETVRMAICPGQELAWASDVWHIDEAPASAQAEVVAPRSRDFVNDAALCAPLEVRNAAIAQDGDGVALTCEIYNPNGIEAPSVYVTVLYRDGEGALTSGENGACGPVPAGESVEFTMPLTAGLVQDDFEVYASLG